MTPEAFISRWTAGESGAERANYALFLSELCDLLGVPRPDPADAERARNDYTFERAVRPRESADTTNPKWIDLYKKGCFILEAKQSRLPGQKNQLPGQLDLIPDETPRGSRTAARGWDVMMRNARKQAEGYVFLLDADHAAPPFILVCDVGHCLEIYADFTGTGRAYTQFPDRNGYRIFVEDLRDAKVRDLLKTIWQNPHSLDPGKNAVRVTREIAGYLAEVSKALEERGNNPEDVAHFLMRCLFTMFAEDTGLLPKESFRDLLKKCVEKPETFTLRLKQLWSEMEKGVEFSHVIDARVRHFNGGLFKNTTAFDLQREEIGVLLLAAKADWREVDPAIFGTLLEQALDPQERRKLGAHYTPRAYVQRLVEVTIMEPLRADWEAALTKAELAKEEGKDNDAVEIVRAFHDQLTHTRVLDPACGTGNFLYVSLELMKQLEGEVLETLTKLGDEQGLLALKNLTVDPHLFLGLELNPRAAAIAELVVWIGYLQWHYRNTTGHPEEPILRAFDNINFGKREGYDAVLTWDGYPVPKVELRDGARVETYPNARRPDWPEADFIVGNPPFIGSKRLRAYLTSEYIESLRGVETNVPASVDYVMYWWNRAAHLVVDRKVRRAGLVSTNSITQFYNSRVLTRYLLQAKRISLIWAVPDHPWVDIEDGARVRVSFGCMEAGEKDGILKRVVSERWRDDNEAEVTLESSIGPIHEKFGVGHSIYRTTPLDSNAGLCWQGVKLVGDGFRIDKSLRSRLIEIDPTSERFIRPYLTGMSVNRNKPAEWVIDFFDLSESDARQISPALFQHLLATVKPERILNRDEGFRTKWWLFGRPRPDLRNAVASLPKYLVTSEVSKHRFFTFVEDAHALADGGLIAIALDSPWHASILSSKVHVIWTLWGAGMLEDRPRYQNQMSFDPFPFPDPPEPLKAKLRALGEELDARRKQVQAEHPDLTLTGLYNVLEKLKAGAELSPQDEDVKTRGLVLVLKDLHDQIDAATAEAYGWQADLTDEQILERLVALNAERAKEEAAGYVRWLRPDYQIPRFAKQTAAPRTGDLDLVETEETIEAGLPAFPKDRYEQPLAIEAALAAAARPLDAAELSKAFKRGGKRIEPRISQVLLTLTRYGRIIALDNGKFAARRAA